MVGHPKHVTKALAQGVDIICAQVGQPVCQLSTVDRTKMVSIGRRGRRPHWQNHILNPHSCLRWPLQRQKVSSHRSARKYELFDFLRSQLLSRYTEITDDDVRLSSRSMWLLRAASMMAAALQHHSCMVHKLSGSALGSLLVQKLPRPRNTRSCTSFTLFYPYDTRYGVVLIGTVGFCRPIMVMLTRL